MKSLLLPLLAVLTCLPTLCEGCVTVAPRPPPQPQPQPQPAATTTTPAPSQRMVNTTGCGHKGRDRIVGGENTADGEVPWQCSILRHTGEWVGCGAVLLSCQPSIVITAAHCRTQDLGHIQVSCGTNKISNFATSPSKYEQRKTVERVVEHPDYNSNTNANDITLLTFSAANQFNCSKRHLYPACIPRKMNYAGWTKTMVTGWGTISEGGPTSSVLLKARVPIQSDAVCQEAYDSFGVSIDGPSMLCAGQPDKDSCQGDSGGPLVVQDDVFFGWSLVGIVSWGIGCAREGTYGVYSEVSQYVPWIARSYGLLPPEGYEEYEEYEEYKEYGLEGYEEYTG